MKRGILAIVFMGGVFITATSLASGYQVEAIWAAKGADQQIKTQTLKTWNFQDLFKFKKISSREKDPETGHSIQWQGFLLSHILDGLLNGLPLEKRAEVDLVILEGRTGKKAMIPRSLISKYPFLLALKWDQPGDGTQEERGTVYSVAPWTSKPKIMTEGLPIENYFIPQISKIELTNYRDQFGSLFLRRRTDPSAMRGEKLFVQNCVNCHRVGQSSSLLGWSDEQIEKRWMSEGHRSYQWAIKLTERDRKSILRYLDEHRLENPASDSKPAQAVQAKSTWF